MWGKTAFVVPVEMKGGVTGIISIQNPVQSVLDGWQTGNNRLYVGFLDQNGLYNI